MSILRKILGDLYYEDFLRHYWTVNALYISGQESNKESYFQTLFNWDKLNHLLNYHQLKPPTIRFSRDGQSLASQPKVSNWREVLHQGATLIINELQCRVPALQQFTAELSHELGVSTQVNMYCSPAEQQGFDCHYDTHDVFILQIYGEKEWFIFRETEPYPTEQSRSRDDLPPSSDPYLHCILKPGDCLYIPRGHWHYAVAQDCTSLHLTVGIHAPTGLDWLRWLSSDLVNMPEWRQSLPLFNAEDPATMFELKHHLKNLQSLLAKHIADETCLKRYTEAQQLKYQPDLPLQLPLQLEPDIFAAGLMSRFGWSTLHRTRFVTVTPQQHQIWVGSKNIELNGVSPEFISQLSKHEHFTIFELADWAPELDLDRDLVPLLIRLVHEGALYLKSESQEWV